jgi:hypothetical protein
MPSSATCAGAVVDGGAYCVAGDMHRSHVTLIFALEDSCYA